MEKPKPILAHDNLLLRMRDTDVYRDGRIKKAAFLPSSNWKDRDGLSVSVQDPQYKALHRAAFCVPGRLTAALAVHAVTEIG